MRFQPKYKFGGQLRSMLLNYEPLHSSLEFPKSCTCCSSCATLELVVTQTIVDSAERLIVIVEIYHVLVQILYIYIFIYWILS